MKLLILTTDKTAKRWRSIKDKLSYITETLNNGTADWTVELQDYTGEIYIEAGRLNREWYKELVNSYFKKDYDMVALHMSDKQRKKWGITGIRGYNPRTDGEYGDMYFWSDENTLRDGLSQFVQTLFHELCHEYYDKTGFIDITHTWQANMIDNTGLVKSLDWTYYQPVRMKLKKIKSLLEKVLELTKQYVSKITNI